MVPARHSDDGFSLIELMVVILIIAILVGIAIPSFLASRQRAQDAAAQGLLRTALSAELVVYNDQDGFSDDDAALAAVEPDIAWGTLTAADKGVVATVAGTDDTTVILRSLSASGTTFCMARISEGSSAGTRYLTGCFGNESEAAVAGWPTTRSAGW